MKVDGQCHCGAIAYEAEVQPGSLTVCHCADCQTQSGSAFRANISAPAASFCLIRGMPRTYVKTAASGSRRVLAFCENCGSPLYACAVENPAAYSLRTGTIRQRNELGNPGREIWTKRRLAWVHLPEGTAACEGQP
ncbi:GFA family protein [Xylophilus rhododendri]|uniref:GFA family protein n=1 Tax=Xylophilus rhododendri TaxID=2697032 RepID=A0A857IZJ6_9BURK|nr:GFA family protein [Xylophilus rhododendri]QHI96737.1 GFA family protein [Xylophilus rhododendri]